MNFAPGDILLVPLMFSDGIGQKRRPVISFMTMAMRIYL
jgi:hypothetical protein